MDIMSLAIGFVVGSFTGATGTYFGNMYTDQRRSKDKNKQNNTQWKGLCKRFPKVINEMKEDVNNPEFVDVRTFFVRDSKTIVNSSEPSFHYYTNIHGDIGPAISHLKDLGYIEDITPGNCPKFRFYEHFIDRLRNT